MITEKFCARCNAVRPASEFYQCRNRDKIRLHTYCKEHTNPHCNRRKPFNERFWAKVQKTGDNCWYWKGAKNDDGYGHMGQDGKVKGAHIISYEMHFGAIPENLCVLHRCDNPPCVRPDHLFLGTKRDNSGDCLSKGRQASKLTATQVQEIRQLYATREWMQSELAIRFGVGADQISRIVNRKRWKHV